MSSSDGAAESQVEVVATGLDHPEGPALRDDGSLAFVETRRSQVSVWSRRGGVGLLADTGGSPNACAVGLDGVYLTQSGGGFGGWQPRVEAPPSIQCIHADGSVRIVVSEVAGRTLRAPNDLCFADDGYLYFTDPGRDFFAPENGVVFGIAAGAEPVVIDVGDTFPNGVVALGKGAIAWVESYTRRIMHRGANGDITRVATLPAGHVPDGFAVATDGTYVVASMGSGGLDVVAADGTYLDFLATGQRPLNCAFVDGGIVVACDPDPNLEPQELGCLLHVAVSLSGAVIYRGKA